MLSYMHTQNCLWMHSIVVQGKIVGLKMFPVEKIVVILNQLLFKKYLTEIHKVKIEYTSKGLVLTPRFGDTEWHIHTHTCTHPHTHKPNKKRNANTQWVTAQSKDNYKTMKWTVICYIKYVKDLRSVHCTENMFCGPTSGQRWAVQLYLGLCQQYTENFAYRRFAVWSPSWLRISSLWFMITVASTAS